MRFMAFRKRLYEIGEGGESGCRKAGDDGYGSTSKRKEAGERLWRECFVHVLWPERPICIFMTHIGIRFRVCFIS